LILKWFDKEDWMNNTPKMTKEETPLPKMRPGGIDLDNLLKMANNAVKHNELEENQMTDEDKRASENIQNFLSAIPADNRSQYLATISSNDFLKTFGQTGRVKVKFEDGTTRVLDATKENPDQPEEDPDQQAYAAFVTAQNLTSKEEYERFKSRYTASTCFGNMKIPFQAFASGFQVTSAPCLGDQTIEKVVLCKDDWGDTPIARQKTREKVVKAIKPEITTCNISWIFTSDDKESYDVASNAISSQMIISGIKRYVVQYDMTSIIMIP
jgi:hypothetical protein